MLTQEAKRLKRAYSSLAVQIDCLVWIQLGETLLNLAEGHECRALDLRDLELVLLAHIDYDNAKVSVCLLYTSPSPRD